MNNINRINFIIYKVILFCYFNVVCGRGYELIGEGPGTKTYPQGGPEGQDPLKCIEKAKNTPGMYDTWSFNYYYGGCRHFTTKGPKASPVIKRKSHKYWLFGSEDCSPR